MEAGDVKAIDVERRGAYDRELLQALKTCKLRLERLDRLGKANELDRDALREAEKVLGQAHDLMPEAAPWILGHRIKVAADE